MPGHTRPERPSTRRFPVWRAALVVYLLVILAVTLRPAEGETDGVSLCIWCGERALADGVLNLLLFLPLGVAAAAAGLRRPAAMALLLSFTIECLQLVIPGRDTSLRDLLSNATGAAVGVFLWQSRRRVLNPHERVRRKLFVIAAASAAVALHAPAFLLQPAPPEEAYYASWTPSLTRLHAYPGTVIGAAAGPLDLVPGPVDRARLIGALQEKKPLVIRMAADAAPAGLAPILRVVDLAGEEVLLVAADQHRFLMRSRTRATQLGLDSPFMEWRSLHPTSASMIHLTITPSRRGRTCADVEGDSACWTIRPAKGWRLLISPLRVPGPLEPVLGLAWVAGLLLPAGVWLRPRAHDAWALLLPASSLLPLWGSAGAAALWPELLGAAAALATGHWLAGRRRHMHGSAPTGNG